LSKQYDEELTKQLSSRTRLDLMYLGRWQYIKDWIEIRFEKLIIRNGTTKEISDLYSRLKANVNNSKF
jgi:hypothetical protein